MPAWFVYLLECRNGAVYTGISPDVEARFAAHVAGRGARYTRANPPVKLLASFACADRSEASRLEHAIKRLPADRKRALALGVETLPDRASRAAKRRLAAD